MKAGYKRSELGDIPVEWEVVSLGDLGKFSKGKGISKKELSETGLPCIRYGEIYTVHDIVIKQYHSFIDEELANSSVKIKKGSILFAGSGETAEDIGKAVAYIGDDEVCAGGDIVILDPLNIDSIFLSNCLNSTIITTQRRKLGQGNSVVHIYARDLAELKLPLPPLPEQQKIAAILSTVDEKIEVIEGRIAQTQELKKGLMQKLLTEGIGHSRFKDSALGRIPEGWEVVEIAKHIQLITGFPFKSDNFSETNSGTKLLRGVNVTVGKLRWDEKIDRYWDQEFEDFDKYSVQEGDLVISMDGSLVGRNFARVQKEYLPLLLVQRVACIRAKSTINLEYLSQLVGGEIFINYVDTVKTSSGIPHISSKDIRSFQIPFPPISEQNEIAEIFKTIDEKLEILESKKQHFQALKKGLMQQLLTGRVRAG